MVVPPLLVMSLSSISLGKIGLLPFLHGNGNRFWTVREPKAGSEMTSMEILDVEDFSQFGAVEGAVSSQGGQEGFPGHYIDVLIGGDLLCKVGVEELRKVPESGDLVGVEFLAFGHELSLTRLCKVHIFEAFRAEMLDVGRFVGSEEQEGASVVSDSGSSADAVQIFVGLLRRVGLDD